MNKGLWLWALLLAGGVLHGHAEESWEEAQARAQKQAEELLAQWRAATGEARFTLGGEVMDKTVEGQLIEPALEVTSDGGYPKKQIAVSKEARSIPLQTIEVLGAADQGLNDPMTWVIRRINATIFEAWQPSRGWLFDAKGKVLNTARPPRRDGQGREWYGAFLPDGRWATTDLWENDQTLHVFSKGGKFLREIPSGKIVPDSENPGPRGGLIAWARSDIKGLGWVTCVGSEGGRGEALVTPDGKSQVLESVNEPWKLCQPRDLEPKGFYITLAAPSDDLGWQIQRYEAGHGPRVGYPSFFWTTVDSKEEEHPAVTLPGGSYHFGFLPDSHQVFVERELYGDGNVPGFQTWFFDEQEKFEGWIDAAWLGDAGKALLLRTRDNDVVTLDPALQVTEVRRFTFDDGSVAEPVKIFADLKLGFFRHGEKLSLARWE